MNLTQSAIGLLTFGFAACGASESIQPLSVAHCGLAEEQLGRTIDLPAGHFVKGDRPIYPEETPSLRVHVAPFSISINEVTNREFNAFVQATGHVTDAELSILEGWDGAGSSFFSVSDDPPNTPSHWSLVPGATWKTPEGPESSLAGRDTHPVIHISQRDAAAYAHWVGGRLPSEVEWEYAASLGLADPGDPSSGAYDGSAPRANTWQGIFPLANTAEDGFLSVAPVGCFPADANGLYDMIGNVWEWTATPYAAGQHTLKGGSFLCAENFCRRYRPAARQPQDSNFSSNHIGFRVVFDRPTDAATDHSQQRR